MQVHGARVCHQGGLQKFEEVDPGYLDAAVLRIGSLGSKAVDGLGHEFLGGYSVRLQAVHKYGMNEEVAQGPCQGGIMGRGWL